MASSNSKNFGSNKEVNRPKCGEGRGQIYSQNTTKALKRITFVMYQVHVELSNFTNVFSVHVINRSQRMFVYLPFGFEDL